MSHRTAGSAIIVKARKERKYGSLRKIRTEQNRKRKQLKHFRAHPNNIKGVEELRKTLGI